MELHSVPERLSPTVRLLRALVRRPSINPMGASDGHPKTHYEHRITDFLVRWAGKRNIPCRRQPVAPYRDNLILEYHSPGAKETLLLEAHQDTVPVGGMTIDPFAGDVRDGRFYGRGACDVKGSLAVMLRVLERCHRKKPAGAPHLVLACSVDEEHTLLGVNALVEVLPKIDFAICAEPTELAIADAHKGVARWNLSVPGRACHSSKPDAGINAIYRMAQVLTALETYAGQLQATPGDARLGPATISVGTIQGGVSVNTVPDFCQIAIDRRLLPGETMENAFQHLDAFLQAKFQTDLPYELKPDGVACPSLKPTTATEPGITRLGAMITKVCGPYERTAVPFGTDASTLAEAWIPVVVFGPGSIAQAHTKDEWIALSELDKAEAILWKFVTAAGETG
jgi:acetylornithine deacetylase/succinyl-diaminopimelate desuccinylase-like protein